MNRCKWFKNKTCTFPLGCAYEYNGLCKGFERFDIMWDDKKGMIKAIKDIQEMIKEYDDSVL